MNKENEEKLLDINYLMEQAKKYEEIELASLSGGFDLQFYPLFSQDKVNSVLSNMSQFLSYNDEEDEESLEFVKVMSDVEDNENIMLLTYFFMVLEFTSIGQQVEEELGDKKTPKDLFPYFNSLVKTGYLYEIAHDVFLPEEVDKVLEAFGRESATSIHMSQLSEEFYNQLQEQEEKIKRIKEFMPREKNDVDETK